MDIADELVATATNGTYVFLLFTIVAEHRARELYLIAQHVVRYNTTGPQLIEQGELLSEAFNDGPAYVAAASRPGNDGTTRGSAVKQMKGPVPLNR